MSSDDSRSLAQFRRNVMGFAAAAAGLAMIFGAAAAWSNNNEYQRLAERRDRDFAYNIMVCAGNPEVKSPQLLMACAREITDGPIMMKQWLAQSWAATSGLALFVTAGAGFAAFRFHRQSKNDGGAPAPKA